MSSCHGSFDYAFDFVKRMTHIIPVKSFNEKFTFFFCSFKKRNNNSVIRLLIVFERGTRSPFNCLLKYCSNRKRMENYK